VRCGQAGCIVQAIAHHEHLAADVTQLFQMRDLVAGSLESGFLGGGLGSRLGQIAKPLFANPWGWRGIGLGVVLGFLPCGLLYAAIGAAAATSDPIAAAMSMAAFTFGTFPMLWLVGYLGGWAQRRWTRLARAVLPVIALVNAIMLGGMAWNWI
jgi:uncharacterized protein